MSARRVPLVGAATLGGFLACAIVGFSVALAFGQAPFGWHDAIGPEMRVALFAGLLGALVGGFLATERASRAEALRR